MNSNLIPSKPTALAAAIAVFQGIDGAKTDETLLKRFKVFQTTYSMEEAKEALRGKDTKQGEKVSPFVKGMVAINGCTEQSAGVRQSQFRTLYAMVANGKLDPKTLTGWNPAIKAAQALSVTLKQAAKTATANNKLGKAIAEATNGRPIADLSPDELVKVLDKAEQSLAVESMIAKRDKADKAACAAATEAGGFFTIDGNPKQIAEQLCGRFNAKTSIEIANAMLARCNATKKQAEVVAANEQAAASVAVPVAEAAAG